MKSDCHRFCFIVDNLQSHHNQQMVAFIITQGHRLIFRAPYYPVDGPIEYMYPTLFKVFWELETIWLLMLSLFRMK